MRDFAWTGVVASQGVNYPDRFDGVDIEALDGFRGRTQLRSPLDRIQQAH